MERNRDRNRQKETKGETERGRELDGQLHKQTKVADIKMVDKKTAETDITERKREKQRYKQRERDRETNSGMVQETADRSTDKKGE